MWMGGSVGVVDVFFGGVLEGGLFFVGGDVEGGGFADDGGLDADGDRFVGDVEGAVFEEAFEEFGLLFEEGEFFVHEGAELVFDAFFDLDFDEFVGGFEDFDVDFVEAAAARCVGELFLEVFAVLLQLLAFFEAGGDFEVELVDVVAGDGEEEGGAEDGADGEGGQEAFVRHSTSPPAIHLIR